MRGEKAEARQIIREREERFFNMSWSELDAYGKRVEEVVSPSGRRFSVTTQIFWDMEEWNSGMNCSIKVRPKTGWRKWWAYGGWADRGGPHDPLPDSDRQ